MAPRLCRSQSKPSTIRRHRTSGGSPPSRFRGRRSQPRSGTLRIVREGRHRKFRETIEQVSYSGSFAAKEGRRALFVTERAVFRLGGGRLVLQEIAPGVDLDRDVLAHMDFAPEIPEAPRPMDGRLFRAGPMGLGRAGSAG